MASNTHNKLQSNTLVRRPRGRPSLPIAARRVPRSVSLPYALWQRLDEAAGAGGGSVSFLAERAIVAFLTAEKGGAL